MRRIHHPKSQLSEKRQRDGVSRMLLDVRQEALHQLQNLERTP